MTVQNDTPASLICSGMISETTGSVRDVMPMDEMNIVQEKLASGIQLNVSTSKPHDLTII